MQQVYRASCHCGAVQAQVALDLGQPSFRCNCSICRRTRFWPAVARREDFQLLQGEEMLTRYTFASGRNHHYFCRTCGVRVFGIGNDTPVGPMVGVNLGCLEDVDDATLAGIPIVHVDGLHDRMAPPAVTAHL